MDWLYLLFLMLIYAAIPCVPAIILRVKYPEAAFKWLPLTTTGLGIFCLIIIIAGGETMLKENEWLSTFTQCALASSVPALYCVVFCGRKRWELWFALVPSLMYFMSFFIRYISLYGVSRTAELLRYLDFEFIFYGNPDPFILESMLNVMLMSAVFLICAVLCIIVSRVICKFIDNRKLKKQIEEDNMKVRRYKK